MASRKKSRKPKKTSSRIESTKSLYEIVTETNRHTSSLSEEDRLMSMKALYSKPGETFPKKFLQNDKFREHVDYVLQGGFEENKRELESDVVDNRYVKMFESLMGINVSTTFRTDDGDQRQVKGIEAMKIKQKWASGMDWRPEDPVVFNPWMRALAFGDYDVMMMYIENATNSSEVSITTLLERRTTMLNFTALHHVVKGAMHYSQDKDKNPKHIQCLRKLIDLGANIEAKDFAGFTPLFYCVTKFATDVSMKLAKILLDSGANPNAKSRLGSTALAEPVMSRRLDCVKLLLERGADQTIRDNDNISVEESCPFDIDLRKLFTEARNRRTKELRDKAKKEAGGDLNKCNVCSTPSNIANPNKRCKGCFAVYYCDTECQKSDWMDHKIQCKETRKQYKEVIFYRQLDEVVNTDLTRGNPEHQEIKSSTKNLLGHFMVKIQIPSDCPITFLLIPSEDEKSLSAYNKDKTFYIQIAEKDELYPILYKTIREKGVFRDKGFFNAILEIKDRKKRIMINPTLLPPEVWHEEDEPKVSEDDDRKKGGKNGKNSPTERKDGSIKIDKITYYPKEELGAGGYGTKIFKGYYDKREVAIKRLARNKFLHSKREGDLVRAGDHHNNVLKYYATEECKNYFYIALQRCESSLDDAISGKYKNDQVDTMKVVRQALEGLNYLHRLKPAVIHLNIKPSNILIGIQSGSNNPIGIISDIGLDTQLELHRDPTEGVKGWMAPELLKQMYNIDKTKKGKATVKVDIFASGILIYFTKSSGKHPYSDNILEQDERILNDEYDLKDLNPVKDCISLKLIERMISANPNKRPSMNAVLNHPSFWPKKRVLEYFLKASDFTMKNDPKISNAIEKGNINVVSSSWISNMDPTIENKVKSNKKCKYDGSKIKSLLRAIRNYAHHYNEITKAEQAALGSLEDQFVDYWLNRFPTLLLHVFEALEPWKTTHELKEFYDEVHNLD